ncbi:MAG: hypothetical protein Q7V19_14130 [Bacteroidales bacterium]|nr:hypothetical protein [Bacteroidales bacterium]
MKTEEPPSKINPKNIIAISIAGLAVVTTLWITGNAMICKNEGGMDIVTKSILPLVATWMGAIIAYYFAKDNFNAAADRYDSMIDKLSPEDKMRSKSIEKEMIPIKDMKTFQLNDMINKLILKDIHNAPVMEGLHRFIFLEAKKCRYIIHRSIFDRFISKKLIQFETMNDNINSNIRTLTLSNLIEEKDEAIFNFVHRSIVYLPVTGNLLDAKKALESNKFSQDVVITKNGRSDEEVLGWIPDTLLLSDYN